MVFQDYYALLEVPINASAEDVRLAYRTQAIKWHPDKNPKLDTTRQMQEINEAYLILKDSEARARYDSEYSRYQAYLAAEQASARNSTNNTSPSNAPPKAKKQAPQYDFTDDVLEKWMTNARRQSVSLAEQTIRDLRGMVTAGAKAAAKDAGRAIIWQISFAVIGLFILACSKSCT